MDPAYRDISVGAQCGVSCLPSGCTLCPREDHLNAPGVEMPKINVYLSEELDEEIRKVNLPVSSICQEALRQALASEQPCARKGCKSKPEFQVVREGYVAFVCGDDVADYLGDHSEVRAL